MTASISNPITSAKQELVLQMAKISATPAQLSKMLNISFSMVQSYFAGKHLPGAKAAAKIRNATGITLPSAEELSLRIGKVRDRFRTFLQERRLSISKFSQSIGINGRHLYDFYCGKSAPREATLQKIIDAMQPPFCPHISATVSPQCFEAPLETLKARYSKALVQAMRESGITATSLATMCGVDPATVSQYRHGHNLPTAPVSDKIRSLTGLCFDIESEKKRLIQESAKKISAFLENNNLSITAFARKTGLTVMAAANFCKGITCPKGTAASRINQLMLSLKAESNSDFAFSEPLFPDQSEENHFPAPPNWQPAPGETAAGEIREPYAILKDGYSAALCAAMKKNQITKKELSLQTGVYISTIHRFLKGTCLPKPELEKKIANIVRPDFDIASQKAALAGASIKKIRAFLEKNHLSRHAFAKEAGIHRTTFSNIYNGKTLITKKIAFLINNLIRSREKKPVSFSLPETEWLPILQEDDGDDFFSRCNNLLDFPTD